jgi:hypothetical protein
MIGPTSFGSMTSRIRQGTPRRPVPAQACLVLEALSRDTDIRGVLPAIVPTLILRHSDDPVELVEGGRYVAENISG